MVCRNPMLLTRRRHARESLLEKTESGLAKVKREVDRRSSTPLRASEIGDKVGRILNKYKMRKHFKVEIEDGKVSYERKEESIQAEERLDGLYIVRTSEPESEMQGSSVVRTYKSLSQVEDAFRCIKGVDLEIRPIRHHLESRVRGHVFICLLSYYVEWHMRQALQSIMYIDEAKESAEDREDPVSPVKASAGARKKKSRGKTEEGWQVYDWRSLIQELGTCCRNTCEVKTGKFKGKFDLQTEHTPFQSHVLGLLGL
jgi:transposase